MRRWLRIACSLLMASLTAIVARGNEDPKPLFIEGYAGQLSYAPGETASLHVSTSAAKFSVEVARIGPTREVVWNGKDLPGKEFPIPENASSHGCGWPAAFERPIPAEWKSGYYAVTFRVEDNGGTYTHRGRRTAESEAFFDVRPSVPARDTKILLQLSTNT